VLVVGCVVAATSAFATIRRRHVPPDIDLWLWIGSGLAAWTAGLRFFGHYWLQVLPPLVLVSVPVVARWTGSTRKLAIAGLAVPTALAWMLLFVPGSFHHRPDPGRLAAYVRSHTTPKDRVFVWGSYPEVLVAAERLPAGGLVHTDFVVGRSGGRNDPRKTLNNAVPGALDILLDSLSHHPPLLILDTSTSPRLGYQHYPPSLIPQVDQFIHDGYHQVAVVDGVAVWQRQI
jgi:hypothetical protein